MGVARECARTRCRIALALQGFFCRANVSATALLDGVRAPILLGLLACARRGLRRFRRRQLHSGSPRLRQTDRNSLFSVARAVLPLAHMMDFLAHEFARLTRR